MIRSPKATASSLTDLSKIQSIDEHPDNITQRKRKLSEDITDKFNKFSDKIMATLINWKAEISAETSQINDNLNKILREDLADVSRSTQELKSEIINIRKEYTEIKKHVHKLDSKNEELQKDITILQKSAQFCSDQQDQVLKVVESLSKDVKSVQCFNAELKEVKKHNSELRSIINANEQRDRLLNVEIMGITESKDENLNDMFAIIAQKCGVVLSIGDILHINRVSPKSKLQGRPRVIVAKLRTRQLKDNILSGARKFHLTTKDLNCPGDAKPVYVNEHLTVYNKMLLKKCKDLARGKQYQYVWSRNGRIFTRKNDTAPAILISCEDDMKMIV